MQPVVVLGGNSWREQPDVAGCRQERQRAGGCHMDAAGCRRVQEDAAGPLRGGSILGYSEVQPGVAERGQGQLGAARCSREGRQCAGRCGMGAAGRSQVQQDAAGLLARGSSLHKNKKCVALGENSSQSDQTAKYFS